MKNIVTRAEIAQRDTIFSHGGHQFFEIGCKNVQFRFYLLPATMMPTFPGFTYALIATKKNERQPWQSAVFGMSADIPEDFREYVAYFEVFHRWFDMTCYAAAQAEMHIVTESSLSRERMLEYVSLREDFFTRLMAFGRAHGESDDVIEQYEQAQIYFFTLGRTL